MKIHDRWLLAIYGVFGPIWWIVMTFKKAISDDYSFTFQWWFHHASLMEIFGVLGFSQYILIGVPLGITMWDFGAKKVWTLSYLIGGNLTLFVLVLKGTTANFPVSGEPKVWLLVAVIMLSLSTCVYALLRAVAPERFPARPKKEDQT